MRVGDGVTLFQDFGFVEKLRAEPISGGREVGGVVAELPGLRFALVAVDPVAGHGRGVEGLKGEGKGATAEHRLLHISDFLWAIVLVEFLKMRHAEVTKGRGQGFQLAGVVQAVELDGLPGGQVLQSVGLLGLLPQMPDSHAVDDAVVLRPDGGHDGVGDFSQDDSVNVGNPHNEQDVLCRCKGRFQ